MRHAVFDEGFEVTGIVGKPAVSGKPKAKAKPSTPFRMLA
jgi:hypothetical protein